MACNIFMPRPSQCSFLSSPTPSPQITVSDNDIWGTPAQPKWQLMIVLNVLAMRQVQSEMAGLVGLFSMNLIMISESIYYQTIF